jgi:flagellar L-ring protein precursor FlgH
MSRGSDRLLGMLLLLTLAAPARAQDAAPADSVPAVADSAGAAPATPAAPPPRRRAAWLSDRIALRVGDVLTVLVDEQTSARERVATVAQGHRTQRADLNAGIGEDARVGPNKSFGAGMKSDSRDIGEASRLGDLTAVLTVRVTEVEPGGVARIAGTKKVTVDGRLQEVALTGAVRPEDVGARNTVHSGAIVDAVITYRGKRIAPRTGILGSILGILWP